MTDIIAGLAAGISTVIVALIGLWTARRYNIGPNQDKLVSTLKDLVAIQDQKIEELQEQVTSYKDRIHTLEQKVQALTELTIQQAIQIEEFKKIQERVAR